MTDLMPPLRRLDDDARDRIKERLRAATLDEGPTDRRGWWMPTLAVAAVLAAVAGGGALVTARQTPADVRPGGYAGHTTSSAPHADALTAQERSREIQQRIRLKIRHLKAPSQGSVHRSYPPPSCTSQMVEAMVPGARTFDQVAEVPHADGSTSLWTAPGRWLICDQWAVGLGTTTIMHVTDDATPIDRDLFTISMNAQSLYPGITWEYVAAGRVPDGVSAIRYRFSDGDVEDAVFHDGMWLMRYAPPGGPYASDRSPLGARTTVTVTMADGTHQEYTLTMGPADFCAQINHGC